MRYFLIEEDDRIAQRPCILNWHDKIDVRNIHQETSYKLPKRELVFVADHSKTVFTDIVSYPFFLISEKVEKVIRMYEPKIMVKELVLLNKAFEQVQRYYLPIFEEMDCLGEGSTFNLNHSEIRKIILDKQKIGKKNIFRVADLEKQYIVGNLDVVESILKRGCIGIKLTRLDCLE